MLCLKVETLPNGAHTDETVSALVFVGPGMTITPVIERGVKEGRTKLSFPDGRSVVLDHSLTYMHSLIMGEHKRPGLLADLETQLSATQGAPSKNTAHG